MAAPNRLLSLNLGTQTVGVAEFRTGQNGGLVLTNYKTTELLADPALPDSTRLAQARLSLSELVGQAGYKGAKVNYAISSQAIFTRFVKLPSVGEDQVDQIVTFEAQQNVPYPINEVVWDYQLVDSGDPAQVEVVIVAIKSDLLDEVNSVVDEASLQPQIVDVAPMAIYNAYRYNYSDLDGCTLVLDIGARTTNLIFIEPNKVFSRSILNQGGNTITQAIAKEFDEPFAAAEERKKRDGFVSLGGSYAEPDDPDVARVSKMVRNTLTRLHAEIARSIGFYRTQQHGKAPVRVLLSGGSSSLPYMREFFHEKFQLPVEFFNPLRNVAVDNARVNVDDLSRNAHTFGELVGLALRGTSSCPMELNLRPASVVRRHRLEEQRPYIIAAGVCLILAMVAWWLYLDKATTVTNAVVAQIQEKAEPLKQIETRMNSAMADIKKQDDAVAPMLTALKDREYWAKVITDIHSRLPKDWIWITSFGPVDPKANPNAKPGSNQPSNNRPPGGPGGLEIQIKGLYAQNPKEAQVVDEFVAKLKQSPLYKVNDNPKLGFVRKSREESLWGAEYAFTLTLNDPISLK